jgi:uncharacterized protein (DUF169 family)
MAEETVLNRYGEELERLLLLRTSPIAVKLIESEGDIPKGAIRPKRDLGHHLALCQGFAMSRRNRATVAMLKEDHWCYEPVIAFGLAEPPDYFLQGNSFLRYHGDQETARKVAGALPRLELGKYIGSVSAPLRSAEFEPDMVVIYCNTNQLRCLLSAMKYKEGTVVTSTLDPGGACLHCTVPVMKTGDCQVTVPCGGDRAHALAQDDEMIFTVSLKRLEDLMFGLRRLDEMGSGYTRFAPQMRPDYPLPETYVKVGKLLGLDT